MKKVFNRIFPGIKFQKHSFSQSGEDLIIKYIFDTLGIDKPSFIDVGAHHPYYLNNTPLLYSLGSSGINIEPDPVLFQEFIKERKRDINLNVGISEKTGEQDFYIMNVKTLNTFSKQEALRFGDEGDYSIKEIVQIPVKTLGDVIKECGVTTFPAFLSIDAEGIDELIVKAVDYERNFPVVICIETLSFAATGHGIKNADLINYICSRGYMLYADTYINSIFVHTSHWKK